MPIQFMSVMVMCSMLASSKRVGRCALQEEGDGGVVHNHVVDGEAIGDRSHIEHGGLGRGVAVALHREARQFNVGPMHGNEVTPVADGHFSLCGIAIGLGDVDPVIGAIDPEAPVDEIGLLDYLLQFATIQPDLVDILTHVVGVDAISSVDVIGAAFATEGNSKAITTGARYVSRPLVIPLCRPRVADDISRSVKDHSLARRSEELDTGLGDEHLVAPRPR